MYFETGPIRSIFRLFGRGTNRICKFHMARTYETSTTMVAIDENVKTLTDQEQRSSIYSRVTTWRWVPTSMNALEEAERRILQGVRSLFKMAFLPIWQGRCQVRAAVFKQETNVNASTPLVMVHGFAGGLGLFAQNFDALSQNRTVYSFDLLGFGRSSRPQFSKDQTLVELEWVQSIEDFRKEMKIDKMILLGHSLGGFLASSYALEYPDRVRHLILVDPWGFSIRPTDTDRHVPIPVWVRTVARIATIFNPLSALRAAGPWGPNLVRRVRPDLGRRFGVDGDASAIFEYIYHCNAQAPSGEAAFKTITSGLGWAKRPMIERLPQLKPEIPMTFIYGSRSWIDDGPAYEMQLNLRTESYVRVEVINGAGHHVYADQPEAFNDLVNQVGDIVDANEDIPPAPDDPSFTR